MPRNPDCQLCPLHRSSVNVCVYGAGTGRAFIVGEAPGEAEAKTGKPFQGKSGQLLRAELKTLGLEDAYITNAAKCRPPDNRKPEPSEIKACAPYLAEEIAARNPSHILLLGAVALKAVLRKAGITQLNGEIIEKDGRVYVPAIHPAYVLRDPSQLNAFRVALQRYAGVLNGTFANDQVIHWRLVDPITLEEFRTQWLAAQASSFDVETTGLDWFHEDFRINSIQFSLSPGDTWVLPLSLAPTFPGPGGILEWCVEHQPKQMTSQNGKFDNNCLSAVYGLSFRNGFDTMLASHLLDENAEHDLKSLARIHLNAPDYDDLTVKQKQGHDIEPQRLFEYGASDAHYTLELVPIFERKLAADLQLHRLFHQLIMPAARAFEEIEQNGLFVNIPLLNRMGREQVIARDDTEWRMTQLIRRRINWNSPVQVADVLYDQLKLPIRVKTEKGAPSTGEAALVDLKHPVVALLIKYREHEKFLSTYIGDERTNTGGWRDFMVGPHLYLGTKLHGTVTGRYSSRLHQVPRDGTVRNCITAPPGWSLVVADFSQVELRFAAHFSRDPELNRAFHQERDIHWQVLMNSINLSSGGEYVGPVGKTAKLYCLRHGLPANGASCKILQQLWTTNRGREETEGILKEAGLCKTETDLRIYLSNLRSRSTSQGHVLSRVSLDSQMGQIQIERNRHRIRGQSAGIEESLLEGGNSPHSSETVSEEFLRSLRGYWEAARRASLRRGSDEQPRIEFNDALSLLSSFGPSVAQELWGGWKEARKKAKGVSFAYIFGQQAPGFVTYAKINFGYEATLQEAVELREAFFSLYPSLLLWHDRQKKLVKLDGQVRNLFGRIRHLPGIHSHDRSVVGEAERQSINAPVQGSVGDMKAAALVEIHDTFPRGQLRIVGEVHDSILMWIKNTHLDIHPPLVKRIMESPRLMREWGIKLIVPIVAELEIGPWGAGKKWRP